jgi:hypothetical protein
MAAVEEPETLLKELAQSMAGGAKELTFPLLRTMGLESNAHLEQWSGTPNARQGTDGPNCLMHKFYD